MKGGGWEGGIRNFHEKGVVQIFPIKREGLVSEGVTYFDTNPSSVIFLDIWCACVFCLFTPFSSVLFVFHGNNLLLLSLINRYMTSTSK